MNKYLKTILGILIILIPTTILLGFLLRNLTKKSFYPVEGSEKITGIQSNVKIYSDDFGVPHIIAADEKDMYFAMGYMHARDRLWQMDLTRRIAEGRLSEIFGSSVLDFDKLFRTFGIDKFSYKLYTQISPKSREIIDAYTNGVNKFIETHSVNIPVEFDALNYKPEPWKPEHSLMVSRMMGWELNIGWYTDYVMGEMVEKLGLEKVSEMFPDTNIVLFKKQRVPELDSLGDTLKTLSSNSNERYWKSISYLGSSFFNVNYAYRKFFNLDCSHFGSNSWVISSDKSETGKPILANDPHLAFSAPSKWYEIHLKSPGTDVYGMSIPGAPGIVIGHNRIISWGMTNLMNDDIDFYILNKDSTNHAKYRYKGQLYNIDSTVERIVVRDSNEVDYTVKTTIIGPVISNLNKRTLIDYNNSDNIYKNEILTFRWLGYEYTDEFMAFNKINTATNWEEFKNGLKNLGLPAQNFMYADTMGNIGYHAAGKIPIRRSSNINQYIYPTREDDDWVGFVDFDKLPSEFNPKDGFIITANTNPFDWLKVEQKDRFYISYIWEPSSRFDRIKELLISTAKINIDEFKMMQMNYTSPYAKTISKYIIEAYKDESIPSIRTKAVIDLFRAWNGDLDPKQSIGSIYNTFICSLLKNIYRDKLGEKVFADFLLVGNFPYRSLLNLLKSDDKNSFWLSGGKNEMIRKSMEQAIQIMQDKFNNPDIESWRWGDIHKVTFHHPLGMVSALEQTFNIGPYEMGGDQTTINNSEYNLYSAVSEGNFDDILGPSMRIIVDLSDITHSLSVNSTGQSGQPLHPNYFDQTRLWLYGNFKQIVMNETEMLDNKYNLFTLVPINK